MGKRVNYRIKNKLALEDQPYASNDLDNSLLYGKGRNNRAKVINGKCCITKEQREKEKKSEAEIVIENNLNLLNDRLVGWSTQNLCVTRTLKQIDPRKIYSRCELEKIFKESGFKGSALSNLTKLKFKNYGPYLEEINSGNYKIRTQFIETMEKYY